MAVKQIEKYPVRNRNGYVQVSAAVYPLFTLLSVFQGVPANIL
jgi:hypothetical protein